ncbi:hypothetical protein Nepgr_002984 [Nepenthes gracilis]|uniref:J domain-containing protein n=1 Tax=Nepenthes gracilis TaxID=150966 RepID=A0AAD3RYP6_NEPGR|nr:hypothetical protein Nepgr_002984 [Nepenthes gracilis]
MLKTTEKPTGPQGPRMLESPNEKSPQVPPPPRCSPPKPLPVAYRQNLQRGLVEYVRFCQLERVFNLPFKCLIYFLNEMGVLQVDWGYLIMLIPIIVLVILLRPSSEMTEFKMLDKEQYDKIIEEHLSLAPARLTSLEIELNSVKEMESNKDEAAKAKEHAEKKLEEFDIVGAKKLALKAQNLFPTLEGLPQLMAALDIYISAERKINGEADWYGVIGVDPSADHDTVRKQYRKLALILHPDKNKSVGAEGAFKILSQAWSLLSDNVKRVAYDQKRNLQGIYQKATTVNPAVPASRNGFRPPANNCNSSTRSQKSVRHPNSSPPPPRPLRTDAFWTACTRCRIQYEYLKRHASNHPIEPNNLSRKGGEGSAPMAASSAAQAVHAGQHQEDQISATMEGAIKGRTHAFKRAYATEGNSSSSTLKDERPKKRTYSNEQIMHGNVTERVNQIARGSGVSPGSLSRFQRGNVEAGKVTVNGMKLPNSTRELSLLETRNMLMEKARTEIKKKLAECNSRPVMSNAPNKVNMGKEKDTTKKSNAVKNILKASANSVKSDGSKHSVQVNTKQRDKLKASSSAISADDDTNIAESMTVQMSVPDPDFHDFDKDRTEKSFGDNQVWAAYDDDDGMPRYYAMVHSVISTKPFKMRISWLNSKSNAEFGPINWVGCGFSKTCGDFFIGKHAINKSINSFSHKVKWTKGTRGTIQIYPRKGDVWALYRNWSSNWNEFTPDETIHKYDMVEVVEDYTEENGATVVPLVKVAGFKTLFRQQLDPQPVKIIPKEEMFRFSHQVPYCLITGVESPKAPMGCWELDPAATPLELLQVIAEAIEQTATRNVEKSPKIKISGAKMTESEELKGSNRAADVDECKWYLKGSCYGRRRMTKLRWC